MWNHLDFWYIAKAMLNSLNAPKGSFRKSNASLNTRNTLTVPVYP